MSAPRLGVLLTHPVQYYAPLFRTIAARGDVDLTVYFAHRPSPVEQGSDFGVAFEWDIDLTGGYDHRWLANRASVPSATTFDGCDTPEIADEIAARRVDALLVMGWHARSYWQAMRACWRHGVPVFVRGDSQLVDDRPMKRAGKRLLYPLFVRRFAACLSVGTRSAEYYRYYGARRVVPSPHFVDNEFFAARARELEPRRAAIREGWGIPADALVVAFVGKLIERKRPLDLVRAAARAGARNVWLLFAGDGELRAACEEEARSLGVNARFVGFLNQSRVSEAYVASDVLALPSSQDTWGLVVNEAMASGRGAIVSKAVGCAPDLVVDGRTGFAHDVGDVDALAATLLRLAAEPELARGLGDAARQRIAPYNVHAAANGIADAVSVALGA